MNAKCLQREMQFLAHIKNGYISFLRNGSVESAAVDYYSRLNRIVELGFAVSGLNSYKRIEQIVSSIRKKNVVRKKVADDFHTALMKLLEYNSGRIDFKDVIKTVAEIKVRRLVDARLGQGKYREDLIRKWKRCSVTGCENCRLLVASHIKPWSACTRKEKIDPDNGLLLVAPLDKLFDRGYITFADNGHISISSALGKKEQKLFGVSENLKIRKLSKKNKQYLVYHREHVFDWFGR